MVAIPKERICHDCGALPGQNHKPGCDVELCPQCTGQRMFGCCETDLPPLPWTGEWPGQQACRTFGFWCRGEVLDNGQWRAQIRGEQITPGMFRWAECSADDPEASEDIDRLFKVATWDPLERVWRYRDMEAPM
jgi:hypothetical protein